MDGMGGIREKGIAVLRLGESRCLLWIRQERWKLLKALPPPHAVQ